MQFDKRLCDITTFVCLFRTVSSYTARRAVPLRQLSFNCRKREQWHRSHIYSPNRGAEYCDERVCRSACLCVCVRLSVGHHVFGTTRPTFTKFLCRPMLPMAVARSSSGGVISTSFSVLIYCIFGQLLVQNVACLDGRSGKCR